VISGWSVGAAGTVMNRKACLRGKMGRTGEGAIKDDGCVKNGETSNLSSRPQGEISGRRTRFLIAVLLNIYRLSEKPSGRSS
jgi:hypothetical protein